MGARGGRKRAARLMRSAQRHGVSRRKQLMTTRRDNTAQHAPDLIHRDFRASAPDQLGVADIAYIPTAATFPYLGCRARPPAVYLSAGAQLAVFDRIEGWYKPRRRHSALDYLSPLAYEKRELAQT